jgi:two-component system phosphate regulon response regulator PhoB
MAEEAVETCVVLVVDDEPDIRHLVARLLEAAGYEVIEAPHGAAALEHARSRAPKLVVTDLMMPVMNGGELIERLRGDERTAAIPIILLTGTRGTTAPADVTVSKPFHHGELIALAHRLNGKAG